MDLYKTLGVRKTARPETIKAGYKKKSKQHHPDIAKDDGAKFRDVKLAYEVLSNPDRRARYDRTGRYDEVKITPEVIRGMIQQTVIAMVNAERPDGSTDDPTWDNVKQKILMTITNGRREVMVNINRTVKKIARLDNLAKRFKSKTKEDPVGDAFAAQRILLTEELHRHQDGLELSIETQKVFDSYDYMVGEVEPGSEGQFNPGSTVRLDGPRRLLSQY